MHSHDLTDDLQDLVEHLQRITGSTSVYVGKIKTPINPIKDGDDDTAHIKADAVPEIQFMYSTENADFMVDKVLKQDQGITYSLFTTPEGEENKDEAEAAAEEEVDEDGNKIVKPPKPQAEKLPKHILVPDVVREPRMHYYKVPRLGSYLAIKLEYNSCLFEEAFD